MHTELEEVRICFVAYLELFFVDVAVIVAAAVTVTATVAAGVMAVADKI